MLSWPANVRMFLCTQPTDMRKQFDGLHALVTPVFGEDVFDGHLFLFFNRRRDRIKILYWDQDGLALWAKRLEAGRYEWPAGHGDATGIEIDATTLSLILGGVELSSARRRKRYSRRPDAVSSRPAPHASEKVGVPT
ncbi:MAG: IS66 family insertion sequence element accessory protein TnpB [Methylocella sp.]